MSVKLLNTINKKLKHNYLEKVKSLILEQAYLEQKSDRSRVTYYDSFSHCKKIKPYEEYDYTLITKAVKELQAENKIIINENDSPVSFTLTNSAFKYLSNNKNPVKTYVKNNLLAFIDLILILISIIVDIVK